MSNEDKILSMLDTLTAKVDIMQADIAELKSGQAELKTSQADLKFGQTELKLTVSNIEKSIKELKSSDEFLANLAMNIHESAEKNHKEVVKKLDSLKRVTASNSFDIVELQTRSI